MNLNDVQYQEVQFLREVQNIVEKDVLRTDRQHLYFSGSKNKNVDKLRRILLNYSTLTHRQYTQGMSDLASPLLMMFDDEALCFWTFVGLMEQHKYISSPKDDDIRKELILLRRLIKLLLPKFYKHILNMGPGAQDLLFAHRWLLLLFKREWSSLEDGVLAWECIWTRYQTKHFHLFTACAILELYGQDPVVMNLGLDETLLHFAQITGHIDADEVLRRARKLLYNVVSRESLPCYISEIVYGLSSETEDGSGEEFVRPEINCIGHLNGRACVFGQRSVRDKKLEHTQEQIRQVKQQVVERSTQMVNTLSTSFSSGLRGFFKKEEIKIHTEAAT